MRVRACISNTIWSGIYVCKGLRGEVVVSFVDIGELLTITV